MGEHPGESKARRGADSADDVDRRRQLGTHALHPGVDLDVDVERWVTTAQHRSADRFDPGAGVQRRGQPVGDDRLGVLVRLLAQQQHRGLDAGVAELDRLLHQRDAQPGSTCAERGAVTSTAPWP